MLRSSLVLRANLAEELVDLAGSATFRVYEGSRPAEVGGEHSETLLVTMSWPDVTWESILENLRQKLVVVGVAVASGIAAWAEITSESGELLWDAEVTATEPFGDKMPFFNSLIVLEGGTHFTSSYHLTPAESCG